MAHVIVVLAPIPGNCNMELETEQAPYLRIVDTHVVHKVEAAPACAPNSICGVKKIKYDWYHYFLPSRDHSEVTYFQYVKDMLTVDEIKKNGILVNIIIIVALYRFVKI